MKDLIVNNELINEWNWEKNNELGIYPDKITLGSGKKVWWICDKGHEWAVRVVNRDKGSGCPYCAGYYIWPGYNDLATTRPDLAAEWDYERNGDLLPTQISRGYGKKVWWTCKICGNSWLASPNSRDNMDSGCPECVKGNKVSSQEIKLYYYVNKYFSDTISGYSNEHIGLTELDIFIPSLNIGIEYDGTRWHMDIGRDKNKDVVCNKNNINLIRIREPNCPKYDSTCTFIYLKNRSQQILEDVYRELLKLLGVKNPNVDFDRDLSDINNLIFHKKKENSLAVLYPDIAKEWHPTKNGNLTSYDVTSKSDKRVWWLCTNCGYEWIVSVAARTSNNHGCPKCGRIKSNINRRKTNEEFLKELIEINDNIVVIDKYITSQDPILVCCKTCGFKWSPTPDNLLQGEGCPMCGREKVRKIHCKIVYCPELNSTFDSGTEASIKTGVSYSGIMACINGKQKSAGRHPITNEKLTWKEIDSNNTKLINAI